MTLSCKGLSEFNTKQIKLNKHYRSHFALPSDTLWMEYMNQQNKWKNWNKAERLPGHATSLPGPGWLSVRMCSCSVICKEKQHNVSSNQRANMCFRAYEDFLTQVLYCGDKDWGINPQQSHTNKKNFLRACFIIFILIQKTVLVVLELSTWV